jgi:hypothetical protein
MSYIGAGKRLLKRKASWHFVLTSNIANVSVAAQKLQQEAKDAEERELREAEAVGALLEWYIFLFLSCFTP